MKTLILVAIRCSLMFAAAAPFCIGQPVQAYTVTLDLVGANVVATGTGPIDLTGLTFFSPSVVGVGITPFLGTIHTGPIGGGPVDFYRGFTGPSSFGSGDTTDPNTGSGDLVGIHASEGLLLVPQGYHSGAALSDSMTFNNATFASLGVTPNTTYVWTWGLDYRTRASRSSPDRRFPMAARQFPCWAVLCSAWLLCGANWVAKSDFVRS